jgi:antitoxin component YwqK of YwqJK toxin-antitoxin module
MSNTQTKKLVSPDGTIVYYLDGKMHNLEGPAYIPEGNMKRKEYYINGMKYSEPEWKAAKKGGDGLPWYKSGGAKARF